jgi:hypothetical protein
VWLVANPPREFDDGEELVPLRLTITKAALRDLLEGYRQEGMRTVVRDVGDGVLVELGPPRGADS